MTEETSVPSRRVYPTHVDVAIVGSGPAGAAYARILSELAPGARVVILEVGPTISTPPGAHVKNIVSMAERSNAQRRSEGPAQTAGVSQVAASAGAYADARDRLQRPGTFLLADGWQQPGEDGLPAAAMSSNVGGMAAHWTGACPRPGGTERIDFLPDLDDLLSEAERLLSVATDALGDAPLAGEVRSRLSAALDADRSVDRRVQPMPLAVRRTSTGELLWSGSDVVFGSETRANPHASLFDETLVQRVLVENDEAKGVTVRDLRTGTIHDIAARFVVVAADSLRTPQVLFASGIRPRALGRYLNDQPQIVHGVILRDIPEVPAAHRSDTAITAQSGVSWVPFTAEHPFHGQVMQLDASPVPITFDAVPGSIVGLGWFCAKDLQESDRVAFSDHDVDDYGMPAMQIHYTLTDTDQQTLAAARAAVLAAGAALGEPLDDNPPLTFAPGASLHYQGSVRMGTVDDGTSVCNPHSEVWGVARLYVAGNGVIPTPTACNPTLTGVALAVGGARHIAAVLVPALHN